LVRISNAEFHVHDQDAALTFYRDTLGWDVRTDISMTAWGFRWICVAPPGKDATGLVLMPIPGPPVIEGERHAQLASLVADGIAGTLFLETDDCQATYERLSENGVVFDGPPTVRPYGIDTSFRDPSGNVIRLTQPLEFDPERGRSQLPEER
jgi:predicted enzyme related to lactoylglutathione lyase